MLAVICAPIPTCTPSLPTNCATPTPVVIWDGIHDANLAGYRLYVRVAGGPFALASDLPCEWADLDEDFVLDARLCRGADIGIPLQRYCPACLPFNLYEFAVTAYNLTGIESLAYSNGIPVCMPPVCDISRHGPCN
jgi:hypothetical protein